MVDLVAGQRETIKEKVGKAAVVLVQMRELVEEVYMDQRSTMEIQL
jgi:hypothetical protein